MKALESIGHQLGEFESTICTKALYRGKMIVVACNGYVRVDKDFSYFIQVPSNIRRMDGNGKMTETMKHEAYEMFHKLHFTEMRHAN